MTSLAGEIYLLRDKERDQVEVYDMATRHLHRCLTLPNVVVFIDITSCEHCRCLYIGDHNAECVHRLDVHGAVTRWTVNDKPWRLSVNAAHNVLVTCGKVRKVKEFTSDGDIIREISLPDDISSPWHAIQTRSGQFIVCHGGHYDPVHRVCMISDDGRHIVHSHGGQRGSDTGQYDMPTLLAVDDIEFVFVLDHNNRRVTLLSPTLEYVRQVVSRDQLMGEPFRLHIDTQRRLLYVAVNEWIEWKGRLIVFSV